MRKQNANDYVFDGSEEYALNLDVTTEVFFTKGSSGRKNGSSFS